MKRIKIKALLCVFACLWLALPMSVFQAKPLNIKSSPFYSVTTTVYPNPGNPASVAFDGDIGVNVNASYYTARNVADLIDCSSSGIITCENSIGEFSGNATFSVIRAALNFDTSFLGPDATILSATVSVKSSATHFDYTGSDFIRLTSNSISSNTTYT